MRCRYCFYADETALREEGDTGIMSDETAEVLIRRAFEARPEAVSFAFQGGEPTMSGLAYFERFMQAVKDANSRHIKIHYSLQTNGLALTPAWAALFVREKILVGVSMDGSQAIHDELRKDAGGRSTWSRILKNLKMLQREGAEVNILCVVTKKVARQPEQVYRALKQTGIRYLQFIPCLDPIGAGRGSEPWSLTPEDYGYFLCGLFDVWYRDFMKGDYISIRLFDDYVHMAMGEQPGTCSTSGACGEYLVVEGDGSLYPCDFYCLDEWKLGNVNDDTLEAVLSGDLEKRFLEEGLQHPAECVRCRYRQLCYGGCKRDWVQREDGNHNYYCQAFQQFFGYAAGRMTQIAKGLSRR